MVRKRPAAASGERVLRQRPAASEGDNGDAGGDQHAAQLAARQELGLHRAKFCTHPDCGRVWYDGPWHHHHNPDHILREASVEELRQYDQQRKKRAKDGVWRFPCGKHKGLTVQEVHKEDPSYFSWILR